MASKEHQELADFIKGVHLNLRLRSRVLGADEAWQQHCQDSFVLEEYARSMEILATEFWDKRKGETSELCRIQWVVNQCIDYFHSGGVEQANAKEIKLTQKYLQRRNIQDITTDIPSKLKLLDVGSCYNPFSKYPLLEVTALDLMPAKPDVLKCDFLTVHVSNERKQLENPCSVLPGSYYNVVVFSLFLEYFPCSKQRYDCCEKAYKLLKPGGLLFILTPDSKHATANSKVMKSWRFALASLGFWRIYYQKLKHMHCMAYRKCLDPDMPKKWLSLQNFEENPENLLHIPQDFHEYCNNSTQEINLDRSAEDNESLVDIFSDLPNSDVFS